MTLSSDLIYDPNAIGFGDDTVVAFYDQNITDSGLIDDQDPGTLSLMHLDPNGALVEPTFFVRKTPTNAPSFAIASTGPGLVAAFEDYPGIEFIQIVPATGP